MAAVETRGTKTAEGEIPNLMSTVVVDMRECQNRQQHKHDRDAGSQQQ